MGIKVQASCQNIYNFATYLNVNPVKKELDRVYEAAKPVLCLFKPFDKFHHYYDPLQKTVEDVHKSFKSVSNKKYRKLTKNLLDVSLSISLLITSYYETTFGLSLSAVRDLGINSYECAILICEKKPYLEIAVKIVNVATNCICLVAVFYGCLEVEFISLGILLLTELFISINEYLKRDYLMCTSHSTMLFVRIHQLICQGKKLKEKWAAKKNSNEIKDNSNKLVDEIASFAKEKRLNEGNLQKNKDYVYVKLDESYLTQVFNKIKEKNPEIKMPSFRDGVGPHFSVIRHDEWKERPADISEIGKKYLFTPKRVVKKK